MEFELLKLSKGRHCSFTWIPSFLCTTKFGLGC